MSRWTSTVLNMCIASEVEEVIEEYRGSYGAFGEVK